MWLCEMAEPAAAPPRRNGPEAITGSPTCADAI